MSQQYTQYNSSHPELDKKGDADQLEHGSSNGMPTLADGSPYVPDTDEEKRLVRKIDKRLLPMLWVMYVMNYIDRTNIGVSVPPALVLEKSLIQQNAKVGGMQEDLSLSSSDYSLVLSIFFVVSFLTSRTLLELTC
jgi:hypothetical protein